MEPTGAIEPGLTEKAVYGATALRLYLLPEQQSAKNVARQLRMPPYFPKPMVDGAHRRH